MTDQLSVLRAALKGRYEVERELGRGGMGAVFLAHDAKHERLVAIKTLRPELASAIATERFLKEIRFTARLTHPHIVPIHDSGEVDGTLYYVMPFIEGESLRHRLARDGRLSVEEALRIATDVADALQHAHRHDVLHRDIKPENILLESGHAVVADFGIARAVSSAGVDTLTQTGQLVGTPLYMSPEQALAEGEIDGRSDVYSLGCVLYEMLVGAAPHAAPTPQAVLARALTEPAPPVRAARPEVPAEVERLVATALARERDDRFATAGDFAAALAAGRMLRRRTPRSRLVVAAVGLISLLGVGTLATWRRLHNGTGGSEIKLVAVLPFENLGKAEDDYFADGVGDDIRGKLSLLPGVQVIARASSMQYKQSRLAPQRIALELGVGYLLTATVRWDKGSAGASRVHVSPELVEIRGSRPPSIKWQEPFDTPYTDVLDVQADIAGRVAQALNVVLNDSDRRQLAEKPTQVLSAYDAYLKGLEASQSAGVGSNEPARIRQAVAFFERAIALDSSFVQAWSQLSQAHSRLYWISTPTPAEAEAARHTAERAVTLAPNRGEPYLALGEYYRQVLKDYSRALEAYTHGRRLAPTNPDLLAVTALAEQAVARWDSALVHLQRAQILDPRSVDAAYALSFALLDFHRYYEAREAADRGLAIDPTNMSPLETRTMVALAQGELPEARAVLAAAAKHVSQPDLIAHFANYWDLYWVLDEAQQQLLLGLSPNSFDGDRGIWALVLAQVYWLRGDHAKARSFADTARAVFTEQLHQSPNDGQRRVQLGLALAYLGRKDEAVAAGQLAVAPVPITQDGLAGPYFHHQLARIYLLVGEPEKALDILEQLLKVPYYLSPGWLKIDPGFESLRNNPRFQHLIATN